MANSSLKRIRKYMDQVNNVVRGNNVRMKTGSSKNFVRGEYVDLDGSDNWLFVNNFQGKIDNALIIDPYLLKMKLIKLIKRLPEEVILNLNIDVS